MLGFSGISTIFCCKINIHILEHITYISIYINVIKVITFKIEFKENVKLKYSNEDLIVYINVK